MILTKSELETYLQQIGLRKGETIMLHLSVKRIGWLVGGPDIMILALLEILGAEGTLMMYAGWEDSPYGLPDWEADKKEKYLKECPAFDPIISRAVVNWGVLVERLRCWPGSYRSQHPDGSFVAVGKQAQYLMHGHALHYGYGLQSPLHKLVKLEGRVLNIGAPLNTTTLLHYSEDRAELPYKRIVKYTMPILTGGRQVQWVSIVEFDTSKGIVAGYPGDYFTDLMQDYITTHSIQKQYVGKASSYLFPAPHLHIFAKRWMEKQLLPYSQIQI